MLVVTSVTICLVVSVVIIAFSLLRYYCQPSIAIELQIVAFIGWTLPLSFVACLPLDIMLTFWDSWTPRLRAIFEVSWGLLYWTVLGMTVFVLPLGTQYDKCGDFVRRERLSRALRRQGRHLVVMMSLALAVGSYMVCMYGVSSNSFAKLKAASIALSNCWALVKISILMGYGLVDVPKSIRRRAFPEQTLRQMYGMALWHYDRCMSADYEVKKYRDIANDADAHLDSASPLRSLLERVLSSYHNFPDEGWRSPRTDRNGADDAAAAAGHGRAVTALEMSEDSDRRSRTVSPPTTTTRAVASSADALDDVEGPQGQRSFCASVVERASNWSSARLPRFLGGRPDTDTETVLPDKNADVTKESLVRLNHKIRRSIEDRSRAYCQWQEFCTKIDALEDLCQTVGFYEELQAAGSSEGRKLLDESDDGDEAEEQDNNVGRADTTGTVVSSTDAYSDPVGEIRRKISRVAPRSLRRFFRRNSVRLRQKWYCSWRMRTLVSVFWLLACLSGIVAIAELTIAVRGVNLSPPSWILWYMTSRPLQQQAAASGLEQQLPPAARALNDSLSRDAIATLTTPESGVLTYGPMSTAAAAAAADRSVIDFLKRQPKSFHKEVVSAAPLFDVVKPRHHLGTAAEKKDVRRLRRSLLNRIMYWKFNDVPKPRGGGSPRPTLSSSSSSSSSSIVSRWNSFVGESQHDGHTSAERDAQSVHTSAERDAQSVHTSAERDAQSVHTSAERDAQSVHTSAERDAQSVHTSAERDASEDSVAHHFQASDVKADDVSTRRPRDVDESVRRPLDGLLGSFAFFACSTFWLYIVVCTFWGIFRIKVTKLHGLYRDGHTDAASLLFCASILCGTLAPLCYNFLGILRIDDLMSLQEVKASPVRVLLTDGIRQTATSTSTEGSTAALSTAVAAVVGALPAAVVGAGCTAFETFYGQIEELPLFGERFNCCIPVFLTLVYLANVFNVCGAAVTRLTSWIGMDFDTDDETSTNWETGKRLVTSERRRAAAARGRPQPQRAAGSRINSPVGATAATRSASAAERDPPQGGKNSESLTSGGEGARPTTTTTSTQQPSIEGRGVFSASRILAS